MLEGLGALWYAVGYAAGYLVLLAAVAAPLRRFGAYTIPDFAEGRLGSPALRRAATATVILICGFYLLPQLKGAGVTLQVAVGGPVWIGVVVLGAIVTLGIASGGMKGITFVQAFQYWLKIVAIAVPALVLLAVVQHPPVATVDRPGAPDLRAQDRGAVPAVRGDHRDRCRRRRGGRHVDEVPRARAARADQGPPRRRVRRHAHLSRRLAGTARRGQSGHERGGLDVAAPAAGGPARPCPGRHLRRPAGHRARSHGAPAHSGPLLHQPRRPGGPPHHRVRAPAARAASTSSPRCSPCWAGMEAPGLYTSGQTDSVVLVLPRIMAGGELGVVLGALVAAGAFAAFLSTSSGLLISMSGRAVPRHHGRRGAGVPLLRHRHRHRDDGVGPRRPQHLHQRARRLGLRHRRLDVLPAPAARDLVAPLHLDRRHRRADPRRPGLLHRRAADHRGRGHFRVAGRPPRASRRSGRCPWPS